MLSLNFRVLDWKGWTLDRPIETAAGVPTLLRRRVTPLGQKALVAAWALPETANARFILSSRHGEYARTLSLLESVVSKTEVSPSDFTLSVHHALIGLLSIAQGNHKGHTAVASGEESFCFGLMEAVACLQENPSEPVILLHFDEPLPGAFSTFNKPDDQPVVLALALAAEGEGDVFQVEVETYPVNEKETLSHAQDFLDFLTSGSAEMLSIGRHRQWRWTRNALA